MVMAHGSRRERGATGSVAFAERFSASPGFAALVFDHRVLRRRAATRIFRSLSVHSRTGETAIAFARQSVSVDPARVVTFGFSMGGGNALERFRPDPSGGPPAYQPGPPILATSSAAVHRSSPARRARMLSAAAMRPP